MFWLKYVLGGTRLGRGRGRREELRGLRSEGSRGDECTRIVAHERQPAGHVGSVVGVRLGSEAQAGQDEGCPKFSHKFLDGVGTAAEAGRELPVKAVRGRRSSAPER